MTSQTAPSAPGARRRGAGTGWKLEFKRSDKEARAIANTKWVKTETDSEKITRNGFASRKRRRSMHIAEATR